MKEHQYKLLAYFKQNVINLEAENEKKSKYIEKLKIFGRFKQCFNLSYTSEIDKILLRGLIKLNDY